MSRKGMAVCFILFLSVLMLSACSAEEFLAEIPSTVQLDKEIASFLDNGAVEIPVEESLLSKNPSTYAFDKLSPAQQLWYRDIEQALGNMQEKVKIFIFMCRLPFWEEEY